MNVINLYSEVKIDAKTEQELLREQLRAIVDKYNATAKGIIEQIGR